MIRRGAHTGKRLTLALLLCLCAALLCGCAVWELEGETTSSVPNLSLLRPGAYIDQDDGRGDVASEGAYYRVDLWLDASQNMGGVNPSDVSIYPHRNRNYREGGFHYQDEKQKPWYESVLMDLTMATGDKQVRVLRYGNEVLADDYLLGAGLADPGATEEKLASLRRDLMTYALSPTADDFAAMSCEDMSVSFYGLGTPMLNQMARFADTDGAALENPGMVGAMSDALDAQISAIAADEGLRRGFLIDHDSDAYSCPLMYALQQMDFGRLNIVVADTASIRRLSGMDDQGQGIAYYEELFRDAGLMTDRGLSVGLMALRLDYMGQISSICSADLAEPLVWGKPQPDNSSNTIQLGVMPRELLVLVIGPQADVEAYMGDLSHRLDTDESLQGERGPEEKKRLVYARDGQTLYSERFTFDYETAILTPPTLGYYTQNTPDVVLAASDESEWTRRNGLDTVVLAPDADGKQADRTLTVTLPIRAESYMRLAELTAAQNGDITVRSSLTLVDSLANTPDSAYQPSDDEQCVTLRDTVYVYRHEELPFEDSPSKSPFTLVGLSVDELETQLTLTVRVDGDKLAEGYYRLQLAVDVPGVVTRWPSIPWIDGYLNSDAGLTDDGSLNADVTADDVYRWETFAEAVARTERQRTYIVEQFRHAWGKYNERPYDGMAIPDCPPVEKLLQARDLINQLRAAATQETQPYVRFTLDVFADNRTEP